MQARGSLTMANVDKVTSSQDSVDTGGTCGTQSKGEIYAIDTDPP